MESRRQGKNKRMFNECRNVRDSEMACMYSTSFILKVDDLFDWNEGSHIGRPQAFLSHRCDHFQKNE